VTLLAPYRVLDLTNERGLLCGQIFGDLGADVIKVEPPGGSDARRIGPFYQDVPDPNRSLFWWAYNRNKRGLTLDYTKADGRALLLRLAEHADFVIESENPGRMAELGLGYDNLAAINPAIVYVSITPFGQDGPKAGYADTDLIVLAASGFLALTGDDDRPPVRVSVPQAYLHASAEATAAALIANHERQRSGRGQHVDVSAQQSVNMASFGSGLVAALGLPANRRLSGGYKYGDYLLKQVYAAKDGHVAITFLFGNAMGPFTRRLVEWMHEEGFCDDETRDIDWIGYGELLMRGEIPRGKFEQVKSMLDTFTRTKTKAELFDGALSRSLLVAPVATMDEVVAFEQLATRDYWRDVEHAECSSSFRYAGPFAKLSETPIEYRRRAPLVGEHNSEVYLDELGLSETDMKRLRHGNVI
jgi:crotonobetainyl-CoA:carnitine CoA-transferase CaiB-like acyl-CoA transferase